MPMHTQSSSVFRSNSAQACFESRFRRDEAPTWADLSRAVVEETCGERLSRADRAQLVQVVGDMKLLPSASLLLRKPGVPERPDTLLLRAGGDAPAMGRATGLAQAALWQGIAVGIDHSDCRTGPGDLLARVRALDAVAGAAASLIGPGDEAGRPVSLLAGLSADHPELDAFLQAGGGGGAGSGPALGRTMRLVHFDTEWMLGAARGGEPGEAFRSTIAAAMRTGLVALGFNLFRQETEILRSPSGHVIAGTSGAETFAAAVNLSRIETLSELASVTQLGMLFLLCRAAAARRQSGEDEAPAPRLALGLLGLHEWLLRRGHGYAAVDELGLWLAVYRGVSDETAAWFADSLALPRPQTCRGIAAEREAARLAGTTAGLDPLPAVAFRTLGASGRPVGPARMHPLASFLSAELAIPPDRLDCGLTLAVDPGRSLALQAVVQAHVDQGAALTVHLPPWDAKEGSDRLQALAREVARRAHLLRTVTLEPQGAFGRPVRVPVDPAEAAAAPAEAA